MELYIYSIVKLIIACHVLRQVWFLLFREHLFGLWDRLLMPTHKPEKQQNSALDNDVVGKTQTRYLDDPDNPQPVAFIPMELVQGAREEEHREEEAYCDTERRTLKQIFRDNERFEEQTQEHLSSGRSFDQLARDTQPASTPAPKQTHGTQQLTAAQMAEFVTRQEENNAAIAKMLTRALDQKEQSLGPNKRTTGNFDWGKYI